MRFDENKHQTNTKFSAEGAFVIDCKMGVTKCDTLVFGKSLHTHEIMSGFVSVTLKMRATDGKQYKGSAEISLNLYPF